MVAYRPKRNFVRCRFCEASIGIAIHRNSRVSLESIAAIEKEGWVFTGREKGWWTGICPACNLFYETHPPLYPGGPPEG